MLVSHASLPLWSPESNIIKQSKLAPSCCKCSAYAWKTAVASFLQEHPHEHKPPPSTTSDAFRPPECPTSLGCRWFHASMPIARRDAPCSGPSPDWTLKQWSESNKLDHIGSKYAKLSCNARMLPMDIQKQICFNRPNQCKWAVQPNSKSWIQQIFGTTTECCLQCEMWILTSQDLMGTLSCWSPLNKSQTFSDLRDSWMF